VANQAAFAKRVATTYREPVACRVASSRGDCGRMATLA